jgi:hypothetical protein
VIGRQTQDVPANVDECRNVEEEGERTMGNRRMDDMAKALASGAPRRRVLKGLLGGAVGAALAAVGLQQHGVEAAKGCRPGRKLCNGVCIRESLCCVDSVCTVNCIRSRCFSFNQGSAAAKGFGFNFTPTCEMQCLEICSSGNCGANPPLRVA